MNFQWIVGLSVSLGGGWLAAEICTCGICKYLGEKNDPSYNGPQTRQVPRWLIGFIERLFFTPIVAYHISGTAVAMIVWITVKMATNWNRMTRTKSSNNPWIVPFALSSLLGSLVSMLFALLGGLICNGKIPLEKLYQEALDVPQDMVPIYKSLQAISIILALAGTFMLAFALKIRTGISNELRKELEIDKQNLISPTDVRLSRWLFICGLILISVAAGLQLWRILCL